MKLKYYLRGLGVGIICTAILMGIALSGNKKEKLTDTEIIERARLLGMVMADESSEAGQEPDSQSQEPGSQSQATDSGGKGNPGQEPDSKSQPSADSGGKDDAGSKSQPSADSGGKDSAGTDAGSKSQPSADSGEKDDAGTDAGSKSQPSADSGGKDDAGTDAGSKSQPSADSGEKDNTGMVEFEIGERDHSEDVSKKLFEAGLIEDASEFNQYMIEKKMDDHLQTGKYQIPKGATEDEILELIVR